MQEQEFLEPATTVIKELGGVVKVAEITGRHVTNVCRWRWSKARGGTDGRLPSAAIPLLAKEARRIGKEMKIASLIMEEANAAQD